MVFIQCLPAAFFTLAGAYQMIMWALGKHRYNINLTENLKFTFQNHNLDMSLIISTPPALLCYIPTSPRNYKKEFKDYPRRKAIIPFLI